MNQEISENKIPLLEVRKLTKHYSMERGVFRTQGIVSAVKEVSFSVQTGEVAALVGESGSGKTTIGKIIQGLLEPTAGTIFFNGKNGTEINRKEKARFVQTIFQDPYASLNPKLSIGAALTEALNQGTELKKHKKEIQDELELLLKSVGLSMDIVQNYPHQFSGGQKQRIGIARALSMNPKLIIADEPVSALDISVQAQILNILMDLKKQRRIAYLLIAHDLSVVERIADRILVLNEGRLVEEGPVKTIFNHAKDPYSQKLLSAMSSLTVSFSNP